MVVMSCVVSDGRFRLTCAPSVLGVSTTAPLSSAETASAAAAIMLPSSRVANSFFMIFSFCLINGCCPQW